MRVRDYVAPSNCCHSCNRPLPKRFRCGAPAKANAYRSEHPCEQLVYKAGQRCAYHQKLTWAR